jgi:DNA-binding MarR family transcriptional regulator
MVLNKDTIITFRGLLRILERELDFELKGETICCGVTLSQCHILLELCDKEETSIKELSESFGLDKSTLSRTIDGMVIEGLVERKTNSNDRRYYDLSLSEKGKAKSDYINSMCNIYYEQLFKNIPEEKHQMIIESLSLIGKSMLELRKNGKNSSATCCGNNSTNC